MLNNAAEIIGKVQADLSIKVYQSTDWGSNIGKPKYSFSLKSSAPGSRTEPDDGFFLLFRTKLYSPEATVQLTRTAADYSACNAVVKATHKYKEMFYEARGDA